MDLTVNLVKNDKKSLNRRKFIAQTVKGAGAIAVGSYTITFLQACSDSDNPVGPDNGGGGGSTITVDLSQGQNAVLKTVGGTLALTGNDLDSQGMLLYRADANTVRAYSRRCTHQACTTGAFSSGIATCDCHGSQFNTSGQAVRGPATQALRVYTTKLEGDVLTISA